MKRSDNQTQQIMEDIGWYTMVALVNETLSYNQWLQRHCFLSQSDARFEVYCLCHAPKFSRAYRLSWLLQWLVALSRGFCFGRKRTEAVYVMHKLIETRETTVLCRERGWPPNMQKVANLLIILETLSTDVFEPRTSTGSRNFTSLARTTHFLLKILSCKC